MKTSPKKLSILVFLIIIILFSSGEIFARNERKDAEKAYQKGDFDTAFKDIFIWCRKKPKDRDGHDALNLIVPGTFKFYMGKARAAERTARWEEALGHYRMMSDMASELETLPRLTGKKNVEVKPPTAPADMHNLLGEKNKAAAEYYFRQAESLKGTGKFTEAAGYYKKVSSFLRDYNGADRLAEECLSAASSSAAELAYVKGKKAFEDGKFRKAYLAFQECEKAVANYKDIQQLSEKSKRQGEITLAILPRDNRGRFIEETRGVTNRFTSVSFDRENPFLNFVDYSVAGNPSDPSVISNAAEAGIDLLVMIEVTNVVKNQPPLDRNSNRAWEWTVSIDRIYSEPVRVIEIRGETSASFEAQYQLIDTASGDILDAQTSPHRASDKVHYADCDGNPKFIYTKPAPRMSINSFLGTAMALTAQYTSNRWDGQLFSADRNLEDPDEMVTRMVSSATNELVDKLETFIQSEYEKYPNAGNLEPVTQVETVQKEAASKQLAVVAASDATSTVTENVANASENTAVSSMTSSGKGTTVSGSTPAKVEESAPVPKPAIDPKPKPAPRKVCRIGVVRIIGSMLTLNKGENSGIEGGMRAYIFLNPYEKDPVAEGYISEVLPGSSTVIIEATQIGEIKKGMCVKLSR